MIRQKLGVLLASLLSLCFADSVIAAIAAPRYKLEVAGFVQGSDYGLVTGMNNSAQTVFIQHFYGTRSYWWNGTHEIELLPTSVIGQAVALDLNDDGIAVGEQIVSGTLQKALIWEQGVPREIGSLGGTESVANAINDDGVVAGWSQVANGAKHLFTWDEGFTDHGPLPPSSTCCHDIEAINTSGQIVGHMAGSLLGGWLFDGGAFTILPDLTGGNHSTPRDISNTGLAVGASWPNQTNMRPVSWTNGIVNALSLPGGGVAGEARAVNEQNEIVGTVVIPDPVFDVVPQAALWREDESYLLRDIVINLGDWHLRQAEHINDRGQILVLATNPNSWQRVILTPVPEPTTLVLLMLLPLAALLRK